MFAASALSNTNAAALQASLAGGLGANLTTSSLLNSSLTNELASNLNNFGGGVGGLSGLQASLAGGQGNNSFAPRGLSKLDSDIGFGGNNAFGSSNFGGGRDFDGGFNRGDSDRVSAGGGGGFSGNQGQTGGGNRQNSNGSRSMSDTILICNVRVALSFESWLFVFFVRGIDCPFVSPVAVTAKHDVADVARQVPGCGGGKVRGDEGHRYGLGTVRIRMGC